MTKSGANHPRVPKIKNVIKQAAGKPQRPIIPARNTFFSPNRTKGK